MMMIKYFFCITVSLCRLLTNNVTHDVFFLKEFVVWNVEYCIRDFLSVFLYPRFYQCLLPIVTNYYQPPVVFTRIFEEWVVSPEIVCLLNRKTLRLHRCETDTCDSWICGEGRKILTQLRIWHLRIWHLRIWHLKHLLRFKNLTHAIEEFRENI